MLGEPQTGVNPIPTTTEADEAIPEVPEVPAGPTGRKVVLVAGSGRSGTSTLSGILRELGLHVPQPEVVADVTNPKGFGEPQWVVDLHNELLRRIHVATSDARPQAWADAGKLSTREPLRERLSTWLEGQFAEADELVIKDPRLSWFLGLWRVAAIRAGAEPTFLTMLRPPPEVVRSKQQYYNARMADAHGIAGWVNVMLNTERATRGSDRVFVRYQDLIEDWTTAVLPIGERFGLMGIQAATPDAMRRVHGFVDPSLRRMQPGWDDLDLPDGLREIAQQTWRLLNKMADEGEDKVENQSRLDGLAAEYETYYTAAESVARSSANAARMAGAAAAEKTVREKLAKQQARAAAAAPARRPFLDRVANRTPGSMRKLMPAGLRHRLRARIDRRASGK